MIEANGVRLNTVTLGEGTRLVAMLHGLLLGNVATWYFGAAPALAVDRRVLLYDLRGHGRSERPAQGYDLATLATDLGGLLAGEDAPVDLVGHSFGGLVALRFALDHPHRVGRLVLVDAPLPPTAPTELLGFLDRPPEEMVEALPPTLKDAVAGGRRQARRLVEHLVDLATRTSILTDLTRVRRFDDAELAALAVPVGLVYGTGSACLASGEHLARTLPDARLRTLAGGHYLHLDDPAGLTAAVRELLDG